MKIVNFAVITKVTLYIVSWNQKNANLCITHTHLCTQSNTKQLKNVLRKSYNFRLTIPTVEDFYHQMLTQIVDFGRKTWLCWLHPDADRILARFHQILCPTKKPPRQYYTKYKHVKSFRAIRLIKPKFHYADFATFTETSPRGKSQTQIMSLSWFDESLWHKSRHWLSWFVLQTFVICVRDKVCRLCCGLSLCIVTD